MADGRWVMTNEELDGVVCNMNEQTVTKLPHHGEHRPVDNRNRTAPQVCAFCGSDNLQGGFGGYGDGFGYQSFKCKECGGTTDFVYQDDVGHFSFV